MNEERNWSSIRAVLFDVDGTLYRQLPLRIQMSLELLKYILRNPVEGLKTAYLLKEFRANRESLRWISRPSVSLEHAQYEQVAARMKVSANFVRSIVEEWIFLRPLSYLRAYRRPGTEQFLEYCRKHGLATGAFSDYPTREKLKALGISRYFSLHLSSTDTNINSFKPSPSGIVLACEIWDIAPTELLYVGDQPTIDGVAAQAAGTRFLLIGHRHSHTYPRVRDFNELPHDLRSSPR